MPNSVANAICGPQVPGTEAPTDGQDLASLNPCPLNACCDIVCVNLKCWNHDEANYISGANVVQQPNFALTVPVNPAPQEQRPLEKMAVFPTVTQMW